MITHKWWEKEGDYGTFTPDFGRECAFNDIEGVYNAEWVVLLNTQLSEGKATELGMAIAFGIPIVAIGKPSQNIFHYVPSITWVENVEQAIKELEENL